MSSPTSAVARLLHLRPGEGRVLAFLGGYLLLCTAATTILSAAKNGLFLSVYPGSYIPQVVVGAALVTAVAAVVFAGVIAGTARRSLALRLTMALVAVVALSRWAFAQDARMALAVYLLISVVQVLTATHAWDFVGDQLTGRQAKRLAPLFGVGASVGALIGGASVPAGALALGTANLLLVGGALLGLALPLLWAVPEPPVPVDETESVGRGAVRSFLVGAGRGFRSLRNEPLLRLMAIALVGITVAGTLIELQFKVQLQAGYGRDRITSILGLLSSVVAVGTLVIQVMSSRWLFPKLGVSFVGALQGGLEAAVAWGVAIVGGLWPLAGLAALDDVLQFSVQKPVEQVSLLPFPGPVKSATIATLGGVMRPLAKALGGVLAILFLSSGRVIPILTAVSATVAFLVMLRHRRLYLAALMQALSRHSVDFGAPGAVPLLVDRSALTVIDRGLRDPDPTVVVFSLSLLEQLPAEEAVPRSVRLLDHGTPEVRAEAARVLTDLELVEGQRPVDAVCRRLETESSAFVQAALLTALGTWGDTEASILTPFLDRDEPAVRAAALVALARSGWPETDEQLRTLLSPGACDADRAVGARAVGSLQRVDLLPELAVLVENDAVRPATLEAMSALGRPAVPVLRELLERRDLALPIRRSIVTALAAVPHRDARDALVVLVDEPALGPAALTSLHRLRRDHRIDPVDPAYLRPTLRTEIRRGLRYAAVAAALREDGDGQPGWEFTADELTNLSSRAVHRTIRLLSLSYDPARMDVIHAGVTGTDPAARSNALELLEGTLDPEEGRIVVPFAEAASEGFPLERLAVLVPGSPMIREAPMEELLSDGDWWTRSLALHGVGRADEIRFPGRDPDQTLEDDDMIPLIERVMILKGSQLFRYFPGADLAGIAALAGVVHVEKDEVVFEQGEPGDAFYMVVRGGIRIMRGSHELALLGAREGFGEMAILDQETRSATACAAEPTTLLRIDRDSFDQLVEQNPSVARGIYRMLTQRLRNTLAQVAAG